MSSIGEMVASGDVRYLAPQHGVVVENKDPEGLWRVRVRIPGLIDLSSWAFPFGTLGGGGPQRGGWVVPAIGADVVVLFLGGDVERPLYAPAWWARRGGASEMPTSARDAGAEAHQVQALEFDRLLVTVDERAGKRQLAVEDKLSGDVIQIDLEKMAIRVKATSALILEADGLVRITGAQVVIQDRVVLADPKPI